MAQVKKWKIWMRKLTPGNSMYVYIDAANTTDARKLAEIQYPGYAVSTIQEVK
jgi:hypothetical protein